jgi:hypothetical protein
MNDAEVRFLQGFVRRLIDRAISAAARLQGHCVFYLVASDRGMAAANETRVPYISDTALRNGSGAIERDQDWDDSGLECYL